MNTEIKAGNKVRVIVEKNGYYRRSFTGEVIKWVNGRIVVREEGVTVNKSYSPEHVRKIADKPA